MKLKYVHTLVAAACLSCFSQVSIAHAVKCGDLHVAHPYATPTLSGVKNGAAYFNSISNKGKENDHLIGANSVASSSVEIHEMAMENNVMKMRAVPEVLLPAGYAVAFKHGQANGYHLMLMDLKKPLQQGDKFPVTLKFKRAGECQAEVWVEAPKQDAHNH